MALVIRERNEDGSLSEPIKKFSALTDTEKLEALGAQLAYEKLSNMQKNATKDAVISGLGAQLVQMKFELMTIKGGN